MKKRVTKSNGAYQVQKGIALPGQYRKREVYPFAKMHVGDSFELLENNRMELARVRSSSCYYGIRHAPAKFSVRIADPSANPKTYRCWRVS